MGWLAEWKNSILAISRTRHVQGNFENCTRNIKADTVPPHNIFIMGLTFKLWTIPQSSFHTDLLIESWISWSVIIQNHKMQTSFESSFQFVVENLQVKVMTSHLWSAKSYKSPGEITNGDYFCFHDCMWNWGANTSQASL